MNPLFNEAQSTVQGMWIMGLMTLAFLIFFLAWTLWAYWPSRREAMREASLMPFDDTTDAPGADR